MTYFRNIFLLFFILFISLGVYCASKSGWLPLVHGPYYFSIAQSLFHYNEISQYAIYPPVETLVYTLQIGISFFEYLIFFISEKYWYLIFYFFTSLVWVFVFCEFLKLEISILSKVDKYLLFTIFFFQPYNLNQLGNFSNESLYFPLLLYFFFSFFRHTRSNNIKINFYWIVFSFFIIVGIYFRLHHAILCLNFFVFSLFLKNKKLSIFLILIGLINIFIYYLVIKNTYLLQVFNDHASYFNQSIQINDNTDIIKNIQKIFEKFFIVVTYPFLLTKFTTNSIINYLFGIFVIFLMIRGFKFIRKENNLFNIYSIIYFFLSTIFVLYLLPFEYSYILPFSFMIFIYCFIGFKSFFPKYYKLIFKISLITGFFFTLISYLMINSPLIEGHEYRKFFNNLNKNYINENEEKKGVFYLAEDAFDHFEEFYWQRKFKKPFCQMKVTDVSECSKVQETDQEFILIMGKSMDLLSKKYGHELQNKILDNENNNEFKYNIIDSKKDLSFEYQEEPFLKTLVSEFNKKSKNNYSFQSLYKSKYFYYILFEQNIHEIYNLDG